jgi:hypothetical protein
MGPELPKDWLKNAFVDVQAELALKLRRATASIDHPGVKGAVNEEHWIEVFRAYLPNRYQIASAVVIDSHGGRSQQMDMVIYDHHFTPTLLDQQSHRYVPAEAVYAVFECKPHFDKAYLVYAGDKAASVRKLHRTSVPIVHAGGLTAPRTPFPIVAGILAAKSSWADGLGKAFVTHLPSEPQMMLDCGCALDSGAFDTFDGDLRICGSQGGLIFFLFRLLSKLQSLGTVTAIDWGAYAAILDCGLSESNAPLQVK